MEDSFLDTLLGHPSEGTFTAWLVEGGLWAFLIALAAIIGWWVVRTLLRRGLRQAVRGLDQHEATADVGMAVQAGCLPVSAGRLEEAIRLKFRF